MTLLLIAYEPLLLSMKRFRLIIRIMAEMEEIISQSS